MALTAAQSKAASAVSKSFGGTGTLTPAQQAAVNAVQQSFSGGGATSKAPAKTSTPATSYGIDAKTGQPVGPANDTGSTPSKSAIAPPTTSLQPGSQGQDVQQLQQFLSSTINPQTGAPYLTQQQIATGSGIYGPQTMAAVAQLQKDLGVQTGGAAGYYGPKTQAALAQKYQGIFSAVGKTQAPDSASQANAQLQTMSQTSTDPVFGAMVGGMEPIMSSLTQVLNNINNPALTAVSLQQEYSDLQNKYNLPGMESQLLNMQNVMRGTDQDIRDEITKAGGTATESQVMGITSARNTVILKQYNALATQYQAAQTNVQNLMQYAAQDQQTAFQRQTATASIVESMASIESQMLQMGMTMQQHASDNLNKVVSNVGYQGLAAQAKDNPQMLSYYESMLGLSKGALSDPNSLSKLETYRQQTIAQGQQKVMIQMYNAGLGGNPTSTNTNTPGLYVNNTGGSGQSLVATNAVGSDSQGRPYSVSPSAAKNLLANGATVDPGTNNIVVPGIGYYIAQSDGSYRLSIDPKSSEGQYIQYSNRAQNPAPWQPSGSLSNQRMTRNSLTRQANAAVSNYVKSPTYQNVAAAATYFVKLNAGLQNPGSIGDPEIIDSLVKINTGGQGAITEQQYSAYAQGQTWADQFHVIGGKVTAKGGTLSPSQRSDIQNLARDTISAYGQQYQTLYTQALKNMDNQGIPDAFWGNIPDWTQILQGQLAQPAITE